MRFSGSVAVVTGGASGIGRATCLRLAREGLAVLVVDRDAQGGEATAKTINDQGGRAHFCQTDVSSAQQVRAMAQKAEELFGIVHYLVNAAGRSGPYGSVTEAPEANWDLIINTNLRSVYLVSKYVLPLIQKAGHGAVVNISSVYAFGTTPGIAAYPVSKAGVVALTQSMAIDYAPWNIRVNAVLPGSVRTKILEEHATTVAREQNKSLEQVLAEWSQDSALKRIGEPEEIAAVIAFALSDDASYMTGASLVVDGGMRCFV